MHGRKPERKILRKMRKLWGGVLTRNWKEQRERTKNEIKKKRNVQEQMIQTS